MADGEQAASGASKLQLKIALMLQILLMLKGNGGVQVTNPGLAYNYKGATTSHGFAGTMGTQIAQQFIPAPWGALAAPLIGDFISQLILPSSSTLAWQNNFINPMGMSSLGFSSSIEYRRKISDYLAKASLALNNAYKAYGGSSSQGGLNAWLLFIGLDLQKRKATLAAVLGSVAVLAARHGKDWGAENFARATSGIAKAVASAASGGYYGNFGGLQIGILAQHLAAQGAFDADAADAVNGALNIKNKLRGLSRALLPLRDIFGNDIKMLVASLLTLYGTGIAALGQGRLLQLSGDVRGTMYATGANMKAIVLAKKSATLYRQAISPGSSGNIVLNDINTALQYTMRTTQPQNSAFMTTDLYRTYAMADLVGSATSAYADTANKAFGMWAMHTGKTDIQQYKKELDSYRQNKPGATYALAMLGLAKVSTASLLQKTSYSDWALRQGFGAQMADTQNYDNRVALTLAAHTAWLSGDKAQAVLQALYGNDPAGRNTDRANTMLSTIYGLKDDATAFSLYMKSMKVDDAETQQVLYRMATDSRGGTPLAAMARARLVLKRTKALKDTMDSMRAKVYGTQAGAGIDGEGVALGRSTGLWALLNSGKVDAKTAAVALKAAGLDPDMFEMLTNEQKQVTSIKMKTSGTAPGSADFAKFFNSMTDALKGKFILSIPQNLDKFTSTDGSVDYVKALLYISGSGDTKLFIDKHIEDAALRANFKGMLGEDRLKELRALLAKKKKSGLSVSLALVALAANKEARTAVSQYKASLLLGNYKGVDSGALQKVQDYLKQGKTLDMLLKDTGELAKLMLDKNADGSIKNEVSDTDRKQLLVIKTLISSQGKDQGLLFNLLQPIVGPLLLAVNKYIKTE